MRVAVAVGSESSFRLSVDFFDGADPVNLDTACASDLKRPPFFTRFTGVFNEPGDPKEG